MSSTISIITKEKDVITLEPTSQLGCLEDKLLIMAILDRVKNKSNRHSKDSIDKLLNQLRKVLVTMNAIQ